MVNNNDERFGEIICFNIEITKNIQADGSNSKANRKEIDADLRRILNLGITSSSENVSKPHNKNYNKEQYQRYLAKQANNNNFNDNFYVVQKKRKMNYQNVENYSNNTYECEEEQFYFT